MKASDTLIQKLKEFEGLRLESYRCPAGVWTIGYGHTRGVRPGQRVTEKQAEELLRGDLLPLEQMLSARRKWTQGQFDALLSFAYNTGEAALLRSTLLRKALQDPSDPAIRAEFLRWVYAGGRKLPGLEKRRRWEAERYYQ